MSAQTKRGSPPTDGSSTSGRGRRPSMRNQNPSAVRTDTDPTTWVSLDVLSRSNVFQEHDTSPLADLHPLVGLSSDEEWNLFGVPFGIPVCSPVDDLSFFIHSTMLTEAGVRPPFTPFEKRMLQFLRVAPS